LQSIGQSSALSWIDVREGPTHQYIWTSTFSGITYGVGSGTHKHQSRNVAASHALTAL
ncbi:hypothetical protein BD769DRAFT_1324910, partial [Suillus cothurnatus]